MKNPYLITARRKVVYDHLAACAPIGEWFAVNYPQAYKACDMGKQNFSRAIRQMEDCGLLESRPSRSMPYGKDLRVIQPASAIEALEPPPAPPPKRKLIPYAGKDSREQQIW